MRLGVNIDHIATLRNVRGESYPNPLAAAFEAEKAGADNITCHLREDRRHIRDDDVYGLKRHILAPLNLEIALTQEMINIALEVKPHAITLVPEKREELTTEGGMNLAVNSSFLKEAIDQLRSSGSLVSLFVESTAESAIKTHELGADAVEFHTGNLCHKLLDASKSSQKKELVKNRLGIACEAAKSLGLQVHVGHGLNYENAFWLQLIPEIEEANIGHAIIARSTMVGLYQAVQDMYDLINNPIHLPSC